MLQCFVVVYIDDILIYLDTLEEHVAHVHQVLQQLIQHNLSANEEKCEFHKTSLCFLGYVISAGGMAMDQGKVEVELQWTTVKELQWFLGFTNFYDSFVALARLLSRPY